jgi:large subunit ribosomal protein L35e
LTCLDELEKHLDDLNRELHALIVGQGKSSQIDAVRQSIAHVHIVRNQTVKENLRGLYHGKKHKPKDLRSKETRAMRRELSAKEEGIELKKTLRKKCTFPQRTFAIHD